MEHAINGVGGAVQPMDGNITLDDNRLRLELRAILGVANDVSNDGGLEDRDAQVKKLMRIVKEVVFYKIDSISKTGILIECLFKSEYVSFSQQIIVQYQLLLDSIMQNSGARLSDDNKKDIEVIVSFCNAAEAFIRDCPVHEEISGNLSCLKKAIRDQRVKVVKALAPLRQRGEVVPYTGSQIDHLLVDGELLGVPYPIGQFIVNGYVTKLAEGAFAGGSQFNDIDSIHFSAKPITIKVHKYAFKSRSGGEVKPTATVHLLDIELQRYIKGFFNISEREDITIKDLHNYMKIIRKIQSEADYGLLSSSVDPYLIYAKYLSIKDVLSCPGKKSLLEYLVPPSEFLGSDYYVDEKDLPVEKVGSHIEELGIFAHPVQLSPVVVALFIKKIYLNRIYLHRDVSDGTDEIDSDQREDHSKMAEVIFRMSEKFSPDQLKRLASPQDALSFVKCFVKCVDEQVPSCETEQAQAPR